MSNALTPTNQQNQNQIISGQITNASDVINSVLGQFGHKILSGQESFVNNLQPGQSVTVSSEKGGQFKVTYLGNGQYQIESVMPFYNPNNFNQPWTSMNVTVNVPQYSYNPQTNTVTTTNLNIQGTITTAGASSQKLPYLETTYNISQTVPITAKVDDNQIIFQSGTPQTNITLQSINLPTITSQQLQELQNNPNANIRPGWYYNPDTGEIIKVSYQTQTIQQPIQQPQWFGYSSMYQNNSYWFGYSRQPVINNTQNSIIINQTDNVLNPILNNPIVGNIVNTITSLPIIRQAYTAGKYIYEKISSIDWGNVWERLNNPELYTPTGEKAKVISFTMPLVGPASASGTLNVISASEKVTKTGNILKSISSYTPVMKEFAKEAAINTGFSFGINAFGNEIISYVTTGKHLTPEQLGKIAVESTVFGTTFTFLGKGLSLASQPVLNTIIKPQTSANVAILTKSLYDVGNVAVSTFGANIATQAFSKEMGWRENIDINEAAAVASLAGSFAAGIKGYQVLRAAKTGDFSPFATKIIPEDVKDVSVTPPKVTDEGYIITQIYGKAQGLPAIGQRILTKQDIPNLKLSEYDYLVTEKVRPTFISYPTEYNPKIYMQYEGKYIAHVGPTKTIGKISGETEGIFMQNPNANFKKYEALQQALLKYYSTKYPEFIKLQNVPKEGLQLSKDILEGALIKTLDNPLVEKLNIYYPMSELKIGNVNFNNNIAGTLRFRSRGGVELPGNERYEYIKEGFGLSYHIGGNKNQLAQIVTTYGVTRNQYGKGWYDVGQYVTAGSSESGFKTFGYSRAVDPYVKTLQSTKMLENVIKKDNIKTLPLTEQQVNQLLVYSTEKIIPPYYNIKAPVTFSIPTLNNINVNQQLLPNLNNIVMPQIDLNRLREKVTQNIPKVNIIPTIQTIRSNIVTPNIGLQSLQLQGVSTQQIRPNQQKLIVHDNIITYNVYRSTLTTPFTNLNVGNIRINQTPTPNLTLPNTEPKILPTPKIPTTSRPFPPLFMPPIIPRINPSQPAPPIQLGNAKRVAWDIAYTFKKIWR